MTQEKMTVHQALCELKMLDKKITKIVPTLDVVSFKKTYETRVNGVELTDWSEKVKSDYQSLLDLITRRCAIKSAVVKSNATTTVKIMGEEYVVAEVIELLNGKMDFLHMLTSRMSAAYTYTMNIIAKQNADLEKRADIHVTNLYGNGDKKNVADDSKKAWDEYVKAQAVVLVDPIGVQERIGKIDSFSDKFRVEADSALSTSNAITVIDVEYETVKI